MCDEDIKAIECSINLGKETGVWLTISPFVLERLYNEYKELQKENEQLRTELNCKDKMIEMMVEKLVEVKIEPGNPNEAAILAFINRDLENRKKRVIDYFRKKVKDERN